MSNAKKDEPPKKVELRGYVDERLRDLAVEAADAENLPLSEWVAHIVAKALKRPDLAEVPRKRLGRAIGSKNKPKDTPAEE
jgi:hypothetical protein